MCQTETSPATTETAPLRENKRVNYHRGMVLGEDDFRQEQVHLEWQDHLANRLLHGYGTVCGLAVSQRLKPGTDTLEIVIGSGYALSPSGRWIWVEEAQCAPLDAWIQANRSLDFNASDNQSVFVKLCYVECPTDNVPIAGQACAPEKENLAPSRILESFHAQLSWEAPEQAAEDYMSAFGRFLRRIIIVADDSPPLEPEESDYFLGLVRSLPDTSLPDDDSLITLYESNACEVIHEALAIWVLEVCPRLGPSGDEDCILLACVNFNVSETGTLINDSVQIENCERPLLIPTRLQQELFCLLNANTDHGSLEGLLDDDHPQYLLTDGSRPLGGPWSAGNNLIYDLAPGMAGGDAIRYDQAVKIGDLGGGDLMGPGSFYPDPLVTGLQGRHVADIEPDPDAVLTWNAYQDQWEPRLHEHYLGDLEDVSDADPEPAAVLTWNDEEERWEPRVHAQAHEHALADMTDVSEETPDPNAVLTWDDDEDHWEPRLLELDDLADVEAPEPGDGHLLVFRNDRWRSASIDIGGDVEVLNDLDDVDLVTDTPDRDDVLTFNGSEWVPRPAPGGDTNGSHVLAPGGPFAIVAAGHFDPDGSSFLGRPTYNDLEAEWLGEGMYRLWFPLYPTLLANVETTTLIVKGTIFDPTLLEIIDEPDNPERQADMPAAFQVVTFERRGILVWITQPVLTIERLREIFQGDQDFPPEFNVLHFLTTSRGFMVEISAYGELDLPDVPPPSERVNLNTASETELRTLPGIGPALAGRIISLREEMGGFTAVTNLRRVNGIEDSLMDRLALFVTLRGGG